MKAFLSYASKDAAFAVSLREELERLGVFVFDAARDVKPGGSLPDYFRRAIDQSDSLILVVPETGTRQANTVWFEGGAAKALDKAVFAVLPDAKGREPSSGITDFAIFEASKKPMANVAKTLVQALAAA